MLSPNPTTQPSTFEERLSALERALICSAELVTAKPGPAFLAILLLRKTAREHRSELAAIFGLKVERTNVVNFQRYRAEGQVRHG